MERLYKPLLNKAEIQIAESYLDLLHMVFGEVTYHLMANYLSARLVLCYDFRTFIISMVEELLLLLLLLLC